METFLSYFQPCEVSSLEALPLLSLEFYLDIDSIPQLIGQDLLHANSVNLNTHYLPLEDL